MAPERARNMKRKKVSRNHVPYTLDGTVDPRREVAMLKKVVAGIVILFVVAMAVVFLIARHMLGSENVRATLERELSSRLGQPVAIGSANATIFPKVTLHLRDIAIGRPVT